MSTGTCGGPASSAAASSTIALDGTGAGRDADGLVAGTQARGASSWSSPWSPSTPLRNSCCARPSDRASSGILPAPKSNAISSEGDEDLPAEDLRDHRAASFRRAVRRCDRSGASMPGARPPIGRGAPSGRDQRSWRWAASLKRASRHRPSRPHPFGDRRVAARCGRCRSPAASAGGRTPRSSRRWCRRGRRRRRSRPRGRRPHAGAGCRPGCRGRPSSRRRGSAGRTAPRSSHRPARYLARISSKPMPSADAGVDLAPVALGVRLEPAERGRQDRRGLPRPREHARVHGVDRPELAGPHQPGVERAPTWARPRSVSPVQVSWPERICAAWACDSPCRMTNTRVAELMAPSSRAWPAGRRRITGPDRASDAVRRGRDRPRTAPARDAPERRRHPAEPRPARLPRLAGGVDLVGGPGHEVPPHEDRGRERHAAQQDRPRRDVDVDRELVAPGPEVREVPGHHDRRVDADRPGRARSARTRSRRAAARSSGPAAGRARRRRAGCRAAPATSCPPRSPTITVATARVEVELRQRRVVLERRRAVAGRVGLRDPELDAVQRPAVACRSPPRRARRRVRRSSG